MYSRERERERERGQGRFARHSQRNLYMTVWLPMNFPPDGCECWEALGADFLNGFELIQCTPSLPLNIWQMCGQQMPTSGGTLESCASNTAWISCASQNSRQVLLSSQQPQRVKQRRLTFHPAHSKRGSCTVPLNFRCSKPID